MALDNSVQKLATGGHRLTMSDGTELAVWRRGPDDAALTYVFLHGWTLDHRSWDDVTGAILAAEPDARVVTYDHRGHGRSEPLQPGTGTLERLADDLVEVIAAEVPEGPIIVVGHSMGGMTLVTLGERHPELVADRVIAAGFVATTAGPFWRRMRRNAYFAEQVTPRVFEWMETASRRPSSPGAEYLNIRFGMFGRGARGTDISRAAEQMRCAGPGTTAEFGVAMSRHDRIVALRAYGDKPAIVLAGSQDRQCPVLHSRNLADALPGAALTVFPGAGHMLPYERTAEVIGRVRSLREAARPRHALPAAAGPVSRP